MVPCATQQVLVLTLFSKYWCVYVKPRLLIYPSSCLSPLVTISLFSKSVSLILFCKKVHLYHYFRFHTSDIILYLSYLAYFT